MIYICVYRQKKILNSSILKKLSASEEVLRFVVKMKLVLFFMLFKQVTLLLTEYCICVPYWQCKDDYSGLIDDGVDLLDIRIIQNVSSRESSASCTGDFDVCCRIECGRRNKRTDMHDVDENLKHGPLAQRILGENNEADFAEFPWMLAILENKVYKCGASLIHPQVAMTAAHCVRPNGHYKIRAGEWSWSTWDESLPHQDRKTVKIMIHPEYNPFSLANDIALLIVDSPFKFAENVGVVCLPAPKIPNLVTCTASGWGKKSHKRGTYQTTLKKTDLPLVARGRCLKILQEARLGQYFRLHMSFICAGGEDHKDTCEGDGGSPLVCPVAGMDGRYEQIGIVSWGLTCGLKNTPGVYVNVAMFMDWIDYKMGLYGFDTNIYKH